ncbi:hypothetical protein [Siccirubricoccus phaeus]|uniref:hypothetical protein n=1 Tax=Siccirubricoccus phaeus TaxID=2595053 RepID=UPI0011F0C93C|nr:hypothetical protein [Siccirubricoccus phaeus]
MGVALAAARHHAAQWARRLGRQRPDEEDLRQDILLAVVERAGRFDPSCACWATFVALLARHAVADRRQAERRRRAVEMIPLDLDQVDADAAAAWSAAWAGRRDPSADMALRIDLHALVGDLPPTQRATLALLLRTDGEPAAARRASGRSSSAFHRDVQELRLWLLASGLVEARRARGKKRGADR